MIWGSVKICTSLLQNCIHNWKYLLQNCIKSLRDGIWKQVISNLPMLLGNTTVKKKEFVNKFIGDWCDLFLLLTAKKKKEKKNRRNRNKNLQNLFMMHKIVFVWYTSVIPRLTVADRALKWYCISVNSGFGPVKRT